ncbi:MAG: hypothetical protein SAJ72_19860 [Jaaginema sp. PMC 1080.18]|nr:hypothetical protein [Jaaginema sp. PMC 1080.18]MEC4868165.1 hypothetical protein [Jaaginema sp. PMC 1078.18]
MTYQVIPYVGRLSLTLTPQTGSQVLEIYKCPRCGPALAKINRDQNPIISINGFLKNFDAKTYVYSLPEQSPPVPSLTDSEYETLIKAVEYENAAAKIRLNIWTKRRGGSWDKVGVATVTNPMGFEWRQLTLLDYLTPNLSAEFGEGDSLGISLEDSGYGLLKSGDQIVIAGSFVEEICVADFSPKGPPIEINTFGGTAQSSPDNGNLSGLLLNEIISRDATWSLTEISYNNIWKSGETTTGAISMGYVVLGDILHMTLAGGLDSSQGNLKLIRIKRRSDNALLIEKNGYELLGFSTNYLRPASIDTSAYSGVEAYLEFIDNDNNSGWAWFGIGNEFWIE